jgi:hypothetical protein
MGACASMLHGIVQSKNSTYREELLDLISPLVQRMIEQPDNKKSRYKHSNRIMIRFFPMENTPPDDIRICLNQFYTKREMYYLEKKSGQTYLFK